MGVARLVRSLVRSCTIRDVMMAAIFPIARKLHLDVVLSGFFPSHTLLMFLSTENMRLERSSQAVVS
jgi:hypothetical protein